MKTLEEVFASAKNENRAALIGFITAGFPSKSTTVEVAKEMVLGGVDIIEVGFPYSDPVMDGPVIQAAGEVALSGGTKSADVLEIVSEITKLGVPVLVMTYWNPIEKFGVEKFSIELKNAGGTGLITPDLTIEESIDWLGSAEKLGLSRVFVLAPSSTEERIKLVSCKCTGFIYAASLMGVTGVRTDLSNDAIGLVSKIRKYSKLPVAVGLGVANGEQAKSVAKYADGVIVGSAFIKALQSAPNFEAGKAAIKSLAAELSEGVRR